jgi:putative oxidoreductase
MTRKGRSSAPFRGSCWFACEIKSYLVAIMRRLFFTYAEGWPGIALLLMRIAAGAALVARPGDSLIWHSIRIIAGTLLVVGLWTPIAGTLVVVTQMLGILDKPGDPWAHLLLGIMGTALALLGPGFWSVDARLFGWKKIRLPER